MSAVVCYPQPGKAKSRAVLEAFARGCEGRISGARTLELDAVPAFYGLVGLEELWEQVVRERRNFLCVDNSYLDRTRGTHFRVGVNALQTVSAKPDYDRLSALGLTVAPWRMNGEGDSVLVVPQSDHYLRTICGVPGGAAGWLERVVAILRANTDRRIVIREWSKDKLKLGRTLAADLCEAYALVTHSSAAANEAVLAGVPVFVTGHCAALEMGRFDLRTIEDPSYPPDRERWAARLVASQWTLDELAKGAPWRGQ